MAGFLGDLVLRLKAETADFRQDLGKAASSADRSFAAIGKAAHSAQSMLALLGVGVGVGAFATFVKSTINTQDELSKLSQKINVSVEDLAGWRHAADLSGVSNEAFTKGVKSITTQMFDAGRGLKESKDNFAALGIEVKNQDGTLKKSTDVMLEVAEKFSMMKDSAEKTALAVKLFGKAGLDMIPLLNGGSAAIADMVAEGQRLNPVTTESAKQAEVFNDSMLRLEKSVSAVGVSIVVDMLPNLARLAETFSRSALSADGFWKSFRGWATTGGDETDNPSAALKKFENHLQVYKRDLKDFESLGGIQKLFSFDDIAALKARIGETEAKIAYLRHLTAASGIPDGMVGDTGMPAKSLDFKPKIANADDEVALRKAAAEQVKAARLVEAELKQFKTAELALENQIGGVNGQTQEQITHLATLKGSLENLTGPHKERLIALAKELDQLKWNADLSKLTIEQAKLEEEQRTTSTQAVLDQSKAYREANEQADYELGMIGKTAAAQEKLNAIRAIDIKLRNDILAIPENTEIGVMLETIAQLKSGAEQQKKIVLDSVESRIRAERSWATGATQAVNEYIDGITNAAEQSRNLIGRAFKSMEDALVNFVKTGKLDFKSLADSIISDLIRIQIQQSIMKPLAEAAGSSGGLLGGLGDLFGFGGGGGMNNMGSSDLGFLGSFAVGTDYVPKDGYAKIHRGEAIIPAAQNMRGESGSPGPTFNVDMRGASVEAVQRLEQLVASINGSIESRAIGAVMDANLRGNRA